MVGCGFGRSVGRAAVIMSAGDVCGIAGPVRRKFTLQGVIWMRTLVIVTVNGR
jgi:hypothetical protein